MKQDREERMQDGRIAGDRTVIRILIQRPGWLRNCGAVVREELRTLSGIGNDESTCGPLWWCSWLKFCRVQNRGTVTEQLSDGKPNGRRK